VGDPAALFYDRAGALADAARAWDASHRPVLEAAGLPAARIRPVAAPPAAPPAAPEDGPGDGGPGEGSRAAREVLLDVTLPWEAEAAEIAALERLAARRGGALRLSLGRDALRVLPPAALAEIDMSPRLRLAPRDLAPRPPGASGAAGASGAPRPAGAAAVLTSDPYLALAAAMDGAPACLLGADDLAPSGPPDGAGAEPGASSDAAPETPAETPAETPLAELIAEIAAARPPRRRPPPDLPPISSPASPPASPPGRPLSEALAAMLAAPPAPLPGPAEALLAGGHMPLHEVASTSVLPGTTTQAHVWEMLDIRRVLPPGAVATPSQLLDTDLLLEWGNRFRGSRNATYRAAARLGVPRLVLEDGFVRSIGIGLSGTPTLSVVVDDLSAFYDATRPSRIETILETDAAIGPAERARARALIGRIAGSKVSKYNFAPYRRVRAGRGGRPLILLVDQRAGDASIAMGLASERSFAEMVEAALGLAGTHDILIKTHPDRNVGGKESAIGAAAFARLEAHPAVTLVTEDMNPYSLLDICEKVFVVTSGMGLEALLAGCEVWCFGMPFYAGWGLTRDAVRVGRRTARRDLEEVVHAFYVRLSRYYDPVAGAPCELERVIEHVVETRPWSLEAAEPLDLRPGDGAGDGAGAGAPGDGADDAPAGAPSAPSGGPSGAGAANGGEADADPRGAGARASAASRATPEAAHSGPAHSGPGRPHSGRPGPSHPGAARPGAGPAGGPS
jgi:hypothetical protein